MKEILIYGAIGLEVDPREVLDQFQQSRGEEILLRIHSPGGSIYDAEAIVSAIRNHDRAVYGVIDGIAFSAAAVISLELQGRVSIAEGGWLMFHEAYQPAGGGTAAELRRSADIIETFNEMVSSRLSSAMGITQEEAAQRLKDEIWLSSGEALEAGLVSHVEESQAKAARYDGEWKNAPAAFSNNQRQRLKLRTMDTTTAIADWIMSRTGDQEVDFGDRENLSTALVEAKKEVAQVLTEHAGQLAARDEKHAAEIAAHKAQVAAVENLLAEKTSELAQANADLELAKKATEEAEGSAEKRANGKLAQLGQKPVNLDKVKDKTKAEEIAEEYKAMPAGPDRTAFAKKHAAILMAD